MFHERGRDLPAATEAATTVEDLRLRAKLGTRLGRGTRTRAWVCVRAAARRRRIKPGLGRHPRRGTSRAANELRQQFGVEVRTAICDLGAPAPYKALEDAVGGFDIDVLVCNHMFTPADTPPILDMPLDIHSRMIDINARAYTNLIHRFGREMRERGRGAIIIVASGAGLTSAPYTGAYAANKAY